MKNIRFSRNGLEFEPTKQELKIVLDDYAKQLGEMDKRIAELKQQLAEKEQETKQLKRDLAMYKSVNEFINSYGIEKAREVLLQTERTKKQAKTDFAIEQIQKAWDMFSKEYFANEKMETLGTRFLARLNQQIKELKGE